ncbi:MAG TPA: hypothetical protein VEL31_12235 [Ktedonobacteraceae bacterium]|nr:hypothetical protein [Ktedonobacteraceae bacterium]
METDSYQRLEQCVLCLLWFPIEDMICDDEGHECICRECSPFYHPW